jgi:3-hydroxyacyl-CoA dehydrogenase
MYHASRAGLKHVLRRMKQFAGNPHADPPFWKPAKLIVKLAAQGKTFEDPPPKSGSKPRSKTRG